MKKILIVSYFFPPSNFAGSYRIASWARYLHKHGYYPVIVTRCWNENQIETTDELLNNTFSHEKYDNYEVYRLPYHHNLRDRLHNRYGDTKFTLLRKALTLLELILQHYWNKMIPYSNLKDFAKDLIQKEKDFSCLIVSGRPFQLFKFAYQLHRQTGIKWIADYRDEWNTHQWLHDESAVKKMIRAIESDSEKKWLSTASLFTTCSDTWVESISAYIGRPGSAVLNGYDESIFNMQTSTVRNEKFTILHNGTLYSSQPVEIFLSAYKRFINHHKDVKVQLLLPGIEILKDQTDRVKNSLKGYEDYYHTSHRIPKADLMKTMAGTDLFLLIGVNGAKGHHSSKIFEYLACHKPVLLCPSDHDVMQEVIQDTKAGYILDTEDQIFEFLDRSYRDFVDGRSIPYAPDWDRIKFYSRETQAAALAKVIDTVITS